MQNNFPVVRKCHVSSAFPIHNIDGRQYSANVHISPVQDTRHFLTFPKQQDTGSISAIYYLASSPTIVEFELCI